MSQNTLLMPFLGFLRNLLDGEETKDVLPMFDAFAKEVELMSIPMFLVRDSYAETILESREVVTRGVKTPHGVKMFDIDYPRNGTLITRIEGEATEMVFEFSGGYLVEQSSRVYPLNAPPKAIDKAKGILPDHHEVDPLLLQNIRSYLCLYAVLEELNTNPDKVYEMNLGELLDVLHMMFSNPCQFHRDWMQELDHEVLKRMAKLEGEDVCLVHLPPSLAIHADAITEAIKPIEDAKVAKKSPSVILPEKGCPDTPVIAPLKFWAYSFHPDLAKTMFYDACYGKLNSEIAADNPHRHDCITFLKERESLIKTVRRLNAGLSRDLKIDQLYKKWMEAYESQGGSE